MQRPLTRRLIFVLMLTSGAAVADWRCANGIASKGDSMLEVTRKCGAPQARQVNMPATEPDGRVRYGAVQVEEWVYGPRNGMLYTLRFVDGRLVRIDSERA